MASMEVVARTQKGLHQGKDAAVRDGEAIGGRQEVEAEVNVY